MNNLFKMDPRIKYFNAVVEIFNKWNARFERNELNDSECWDFFYSLEKVIRYYWKYIKRYYKSYKNERIHTLVEGFKRAKADGFINDADVWLECLEDMNRVLNIQDSNQKLKVLKEFLEIYRKKVPLMYECMHSPENIEMMNSAAQVMEIVMAKPMSLADNKPVYSSSELGITETSYKHLLNYFKSESCIKNVWLYGSRLHGQNTYSSDLDLIVDCPASEIQRIKEDVKELPIPYLCDFCNIYLKKDEAHIKMSTSLGTKKIYCVDDFDTHWDYQYKNKSLSIDISSIIMENETFELNYESWENYYAIYKNKYKHISELVKKNENFDNYNEDEVYNVFNEYYSSINHLLFLYLNNNGLFFNEGTPCIRESFSIGLIDDGEAWIELDYMMWKAKRNKCSKSDVLELLLNKFAIFVDLDNKFAQLAVKNG